MISVSHLLQQWERRGQEIRLLSGHFPLSAIDLIDADFRTISVLRPPVERTLSYLRHQRALDPEKRDAPLDEIYDDPFLFRGLIRNHMTRTFSLGSDELGPGDGVLTDIEDTRERLDRAKLGVEGLDAYGLSPASRSCATRCGRGSDSTSANHSVRTPPDRHRSPKDSSSGSGTTTRSTSSSTSSPRSCTRHGPAAHGAARMTRLGSKGGGTVVLSDRPVNFSHMPRTRGTALTRWVTREARCRLALGAPDRCYRPPA